MRFVLPLVLCLSLLLVGDAAAGEELDRKQVQALMEKLQRAVQEKDGAALESAFDFDEILASWERLGYFVGVSEKDLSGVKTKRAEVVRGVLRAGRLIVPFHTFEVRSVRVGDRAGTLVAHVRLRSEVAGLSKLNVRLIRRGDAVRISEIDDVNSGIGYMALIGSLFVEARMGSTAAHTRGWAQATSNIDKAQVLLAQESYQEAYDLLAPAQELDLPDVLHAFVQVILASASLGTGEFARCIDHADQAYELKPDMPLVHYLKTFAWGLLEEPARALAEARLYTAEVGDDPDIDLETGKALYALERSAEAIVSLRRSLANDPFDPEALAYFACVSKGGQKEELATYFGRLQDAATVFPEMAEICIEEEAAEALRALTELYAKVAPGDFQVPFYRGRALLLEGKSAEAAPLLRRALGQLGNREMDAAEKGPYIEAWLDAMAQQHKHLEAFDQAPDRHLALTWLADGISVHGDADLLSELLARAVKDEALLPWRRYYGAEVHYLRSQFEDAARILSLLRKELLTQVEDSEALLDLLWKVEDRLIRSFVRTTGADLEAALRLAQEIAARDDDLDYVIIVLAHKGEVAATTAAIRKAVEAGRDPTWIFEDEDLEEVLSGEAYKALRDELLR